MPVKFNQKIHLACLLAAAFSPAMAADCVSGATISSSTTCTVPAGANNVSIKAWGGGAAGGSGAFGSGGGGGGAYCQGSFAVTAGTVLTVTVGLGGA